MAHGFLVPLTSPNSCLCKSCFKVAFGKFGQIPNLAPENIM